MAKVTDFFAMSRHERRGLIAVALLLIAALATAWMVSRGNDEPVPVDDAQVRLFKQRCDSLAEVQAAMKPGPKKGTKRKKAAKSKKTKQSGNRKSSPQPRRIDPVTNF